MKKYMLALVFFFSIFFCNYVFAACTGSSPTWTCTPDYTSLNGLINGGSPSGFTYNDTINVISGTVDWGANTLLIKKGMKLIGAGRDSTIINGTAQYQLVYSPDNTSASNNYTFKLEGFAFQSGLAVTDDENFKVDNVYIGAVNTGTILKTNIAIGMNSFKLIRIAGTFAGVVYGNNVTGSGNVIQNVGRGATEWNHVDIKNDFDFGTYRAMYYEDNIFTNEGHIYTENGGASRWIWRYNTNTSSQMEFPFLDTHGCQPTGSPGSMLVAYYGNIFTWSDAGTWFYQRGGRALMFNNINKGYGTQIWQEQMYDAAVYCPKITEADVVPNKSYFFNNWKNTTLCNAYEPSSSDPYNYIAENDSFYNYNASCSGTGNCASGIGCGSSVPTGTCVEGTAYWVTNYPSGCSTPPSTMADMRTYTQAGRLYRCNSSGGWELFFTPYTYPHPLRGLGKRLSGGVVAGGTF